MDPLRQHLESVTCETQSKYDFGVRSSRNIVLVYQPAKISSTAIANLLTFAKLHFILEYIDSELLRQLRQLHRFRRRRRGTALKAAPVRTAYFRSRNHPPTRAPVHTIPFVRDRPASCDRVHETSGGAFARASRK